MKKQILRYLDIPVFMIVIMLIDFLFRWRMGFEIGLNFSLGFSIVYLVFLASVMLLLGKKARLIVEVAVSLVFAVYVFSQTLHYAYFNVFFSINKIVLINELSGVANSIFGKITLRDGLYFVPMIMLVAINIYLSKYTAPKNLYEKVLALILIVISSLGMNQFDNIIPSDSDWASDMKYNYENLSNKNKAISDFGTLTYMHLDVYKTSNRLFKKADRKSLEEVQEFVESNKFELTENEMSGIFKDKNLIMIQCESLSNLALNETVMPTVSRMAKEGIYFSNFYAPIYQSATADTEFISQTSLIPSIDNAPTAYTYQNNHYDGSLASLFLNKGYSANSFHSYNRVFYNREQLHEAMYFSTFYDKDLLGITYPEGYEDGINWPSDEELMWRMMKKVASTPFYHFVITATGHMPYVGYRPEYEGEYYHLSQVLLDQDDEMLSYFASQSHLDRSIQTLLTILEDEGHLENTVIVLFGDHYPYGLSEEKQKMYFDDEIQKYKVPFVIYSGSQEFNLKIDKLCSTFDLLPTLANMFGLQIENQYYAGIDVFSDQESVVYFSDRSWMTESLYYDSTSLSMVDNQGNKTNDYRDVQKKMNEIYEMSQKMLELDYYGE